MAIEIPSEEQISNKGQIRRKERGEEEKVAVIFHDFQVSRMRMYSINIFIALFRNFRRMIHELRRNAVTEHDYKCKIVI